MSSEILTHPVPKAELKLLVVDLVPGAPVHQSWANTWVGTSFPWGRYNLRIHPNFCYWELVGLCTGCRGCLSCSFTGRVRRNISLRISPPAFTHEWILKDSTMLSCFLPLASWLLNFLKENRHRRTGQWLLGVFQRGHPWKKTQR